MDQKFTEKNPNMRLNNGNEDQPKNDRVLNAIQFSNSVRRSFKMRMRDGKSEVKKVGKSVG